MPQSMLALFALLLVTLLAVQQQRRTADHQFAMVRNEVSMMATGVATDRLEEVSALAFDENTRFGARQSGSGGLTAPNHFGPGVDTPSDDVDDMHEVALDMVRVVGDDSLFFRVHTRVNYADPADPDAPSAARSKFKKVSVRAYNTHLGPALVDTIRLSQTVACGSACDW